MVTEQANSNAPTNHEGLPVLEELLEGQLSEVESRSEEQADLLGDDVPELSEAETLHAVFGEQRKQRRANTEKEKRKTANKAGC